MQKLYFTPLKVKGILQHWPDNVLGPPLQSVDGVVVGGDTVQTKKIDHLSAVYSSKFAILRGDVCKYRPDEGKTKFLKKPQKIM